MFLLLAVNDAQAQYVLSEHYDKGRHHIYNFQFDSSAYHFSMAVKLFDQNPPDSIRALITYYQAMNNIWTLGRYKHLQKAEHDLPTIYQATDNIQLKDRIELFYRLAEFHNRDYYQAYFRLHNYLADYEEKHGEKHPDRFIWKPLLAFGAHFSQADFEKGHDLYLECISEYEETYGQKSGGSAIMHLLLSLLYYYTSEITLAQDAIQKAVTIATESKPGLSSMLPILMRFKASYQIGLGETEQGLDLAIEAMHLAGTAYQKAYVQMMVGKGYAYLGENQKAIDNYEQSLAGMHSIFGYHPEYCNVLDEYASAMGRLQAYDQILSLKDRHEDLPPSAYRPGYGSNISLPYHLSKYYAAQGDYSSALQQMQLIFPRSYTGVDSLIGLENPLVSQLPIHRGPVRNLSMKAGYLLKYFLSDSTSAEYILDLAIETAFKADSLFTSILATNQNPDSKIRSLNQYASYFPEFIHAAWYKWQMVSSSENFRDLLYFVERSKSLELYREWRERNSRAYERVAKDILDKEKKINQQLIALRISDDNGDEDSDRQQELRSELMAVQAEIRQALEDAQFIEMNRIHMDLNKIQGDLNSDELLIEYFYDDASLYILGISKKDHFAIRKPINQNLDELIQAFREAIYKPFISIESLDTSIDIVGNEELTSLLLTDEMNRYAKWIIIPDKNLGLLPFEALQIDGNYIIQQHQIHYAYAIHVYYELLQRGKGSESKPRSIAVFAPDFPVSDSNFNSHEQYRGGYLGPLKFAPDEIKAINSLHDAAQIFKANTASKSNFKDILHDFDWIHVISHAKHNVGDNDLSFIAMTSQIDPNKIEKIFLNEIQLVECNADVVVLSACETGVGELVRGEGVSSFGRSFMSAGARSVIQSLWSVNDRSTAQIMKGFYEHLNSGMSKDAALREAKLDYLDKAGPENLHPYFWSGFVAIGDMSPVSNPTTSFHIWWVLTLIVLFLVLRFIMKRI